MAVVTASSVVALGMGAALQSVIAREFGAGAAMDAYLAAAALPQYLVSVLLGAVVVVFLPVFVERIDDGSQAHGWRLAVHLLNLCVAGLGLIAITSALLANEVLTRMLPGLPPPTLEGATQIARVLWPSLALTAAVQLLLAVHQSLRLFTRCALVPVAGLGVNILVVIVCAPRHGIMAAVAGTVVATVLQLALLWPILPKGAWVPSLGLSEAGVRRVMAQAWPLVASGIFVRATGVIDRYLASWLPEGSLSHLGYAAQVVTVLAAQVAVGVAGVGFPDMAIAALGTGPEDLRTTFARLLRLMGALVTPVAALTVVLAGPLTEVLFRRGSFSAHDALAVAGLFVWYTPALVAAALGAVTGRTLYVLRATRLVAIMGIIETLAYAVYAPWLCGRLGTAGLALSFSVYHGLSVAWHLAVLWFRLGRRGGAGMVIAFLRLGLAGLLAGWAAHTGASLATNPWVALVTGAGAGISAYAVAVLLLGLEGVGDIRTALLGPARPDKG